MMLHDAIRYARMEQRLSQKKLAEKAGIQRRQLATLEKGGNVTLATVRKVLAQLPNLESFTLDTVEVNVTSPPPKHADIANLKEAMVLVGRAFQDLAQRLENGHIPQFEDLSALHDVLNNIPPAAHIEMIKEEAERIIAEEEGRK